MKEKKKLKIAQVAPLWITVPPEKYGGIERIVASLTDHLSERGHDVTLFAAPGSKTKAKKLISVYPKPLLKAGINWKDNFWNLKNLETAYEMADRGKFDIVHTHLDIWSLFFYRLVDVPSVHTMHNPILSPAHIAAKAKSKKNGISEDGVAKESSRHSIYRSFKDDFNIAFISEKANELSGIKFKNSKVIYNGIDMDKLKFNAKPKDHFVWVARIDKYKGIENAIEIAKRAGVKLLLAGRLDKASEEYFKKVIKPKLNKNVKFIGELNGSQMSKFYREAKALLYPIEWEEPFGLVVAEAMACGTPVIAFDRGSMSELIEDGKTGFVVNTISEAVMAVKKIDSLDRRYIRDYVNKHFSDEVMVDNYEKLYFDILNSKKK